MKNNAITIILIGLANLSFAQADNSAIEAKKTAIEKFSISENFRGFAYVWESPNLRENQFIIKIDDEGFKGKKFDGVLVSLNKNGDIDEFAPYFIDVSSNSLDLQKWAYQSLQQRKITVSALWEVIRAAEDEKTLNGSLLESMIFNLQTGVDYPALEDLKVVEGGQLHKVIWDEIRQSVKPKNSVKITNLMQAARILQLDLGK